MTSPQTATILTPEERLARRNLIVRDAFSLLTLFLITTAIFGLTWLLYQSFRGHQQELGLRWKARGEAALQAGRPREAVDALRSALMYVPTRETEIELATALAAAGRTPEAASYFESLWESAPGDGLINLELARLAAKQGQEAAAIQHYQASLDGTWQGNGFNRRREIRLELARYLISRKQDGQARAQLLIASSNAPDDPAIKLEVAGLLEQANDPQDALGIYRSVAARKNAPIAASLDAGRTAFGLGQYRVAAQYLGRALGSSQVEKLPDNEKMADRNMLDTSLHILLLYPALNLAPDQRAERILSARSTTRARLLECAASNGTAAGQLAPLVARWDQLPARLTLKAMEQDPDLEQSMMQLIYDTEILTAQVCGPPAGDDALLLRIAQNPDGVELD